MVSESLMERAAPLEGGLGFSSMDEASLIRAKALSIYGAEQRPLLARNIRGPLYAAYQGAPPMRIYLRAESALEEAGGANGPR